MVPLLVILTIVAYLLAAFFFWSDRSFRPLILLLAGSIATLSQPVWGRLLGTAPDVPGSVIRAGTFFTLPFWTFLGGGVLLALPPMLVAYGLRHRWWSAHYAAAWAFFTGFVLFFLIEIALETRSETIIFARPRLPRPGLPEALFEAVMLATISFGLLYTFVSTRHYALQIAFLPLLISGLAASFLFIGILCSPYWVASLLQQRDQVVLVGAAISVALVVWSIHLLASGLHAGRRQRLQWR
jgi:hypothetical protein